MVTQLAFYVLVFCLAVQRLVELRKSRRNEDWMRAQGAREHAAGQYRVMQLLHAAWFAAMILEVERLGAAFVPGLAVSALVGVLAGQALRHAAMRALGRQWSVRVFSLPGQPAVTKGIYRHLRHPNYLGVVLEIACVPLLHGAWRTSILFSIANAVLLAFRVRAEERALERDGDYASRLGDRPRWVPVSGFGVGTRTRRHT